VPAGGEGLDDVEAVAVFGDGLGPDPGFGGAALVRDVDAEAIEMEVDGDQDLATVAGGGVGDGVGDQFALMSSGARALTVARLTPASRWPVSAGS
jgi:hypothetical protein